MEIDVNATGEKVRSSVVLEPLHAREIDSGAAWDTKESRWSKAKKDHEKCAEMEKTSHLGIL